MAEHQPQLSFVVTCKGRLHHLRRTLPLLSAQRGTQTIVVDANCPDDTATWVNAHHPAVKVVKIESMPRFNISTARNAGFAAVSTPWVCFTDADVMIADDFGSRIQALLKPSSFFTFQTTKDTFGVAGTVIAESEAVQRCGGYDDVMQGYGGEDFDLYNKLSRQGAKEIKLEPGLVVRVLENTVADRAKYYDEKDIRFTIVVNGLYRILKNHVRNLNPDIDHDKPARERIHAEARRAAHLAREAPDGRISFKVPLPPDKIMYPAYAELKQVLELDLKLADVFRAGQ